MTELNNVQLPTSSELPNRGVLDASSQEKTALLVEVYHRNPGVHKALKILRDVWLRGADRPTFEIPRREGAQGPEVFDRSFHPIVDHQVNAMLAADSLADIVGLNDQERNLFVTNAMMHDADKYLEIQMLSLRSLKKSSINEQSGRNLVKSAIDEFWHKDYQDEEASELIDLILEPTSPEKFHNAFDSSIKQVLIHNELNDKGFSNEEVATLSRLNMSDSVGELPALFARVIKFLPEDLDDEVTKQVKTFGNELSSRGLLPHVEADRVDFMAMLTLHCDTLSSWDPQAKAHAIGSAEERIRQIVERRQYTELDDDYRQRYGTGYWDMALLIQQATERIIRDHAIELGTIHESVTPEQIPMAIFQRLQDRVNRFKEN